MDQKLENILNLALGAPEEEREQTERSECLLQRGDPQLGADRKYHGSLDRLREQNIVVEELIAGYAILTVPRQLVDTVSGYPGDQYVENLSGFIMDRRFPGGHPVFHRSL